MPAARTRVAVFVDYQNTHRGALRAFHPPNTSPAQGHINPVALGECIVAKRRMNGLDCELAEVRVYRGRPSPDRQPLAAAANDRQTDAWNRLPKVRVLRRPLRYPTTWPSEPAQEKGVDVALATDVVRLALEGVYEVGVIVSADTDLLPALETVIKLDKAHIEVAAWRRQNRLRFPDSGLWCHWLDIADYHTMADPNDYRETSS